MNKVLCIIIAFFLLNCAKPNNDQNKTSGFGVSEQTKVGHSTPQEFQKYQENKRPFLIYYAVDGPATGGELFMNYSVDHEINELRNICNGSPQVNWIILRNSEIAKTQSYEICNQGVHKIKSLKFFYDNMRDLAYKMFDSQNPILTDCNPNDVGDYMINNVGLDLVKCNGSIVFPHGINFRFNQLDQVFTELNINVNSNQLSSQVQQVLSDSKVNASYAKIYGEDYPLINPYFLLGIVTNRILHPFHPKNFIPIWYLKSHGHYDYALTGLMPHQILEKNLQQEEIIRTNPNERSRYESPLSYLNKLDTRTGLSLSQDDICSLETANSIHTLGANSPHSLGSGSIFLGNQPGISPESLIEILSYSKNILKDENYDNFEAYESLYVIIGACDASIGPNQNGGRWKILNPTTQKRIKYLYSPIGSLNYRNYDWNRFFNYLGQFPDANSHAQIAQKVLTETLYEIPNDTSSSPDTFNTYTNVVKRFSTKISGENQNK